jgi:hypothetical protein
MSVTVGKLAMAIKKAMLKFCFTLIKTFKVLQDSTVCIIRKITEGLLKSCQNFQWGGSSWVSPRPYLSDFVVSLIRGRKKTLTIIVSF